MTDRETITTPRYLLVGSEGGQASVYCASEDYDECIQYVADCTEDVNWHCVFDRHLSHITTSSQIALAVLLLREDREDDVAHAEHLRQVYGERR